MFQKISNKMILYHQNLLNETLKTGREGFIMLVYFSLRIDSGILKIKHIIKYSKVTKSTKENQRKEEKSSTPHQITGIFVYQWKTERWRRRVVTTCSIQNRCSWESLPAPAAAQETDSPLDFEDSVFYASNLTDTQQERIVISSFQLVSYFGMAEIYPLWKPKICKYGLSRLYGGRTL